jgi:hypothetical protein
MNEPKTVFVGFQTLKIGVLDTVICFNEASAVRCNVLQVLGMSPGENVEKKRCCCQTNFELSRLKRQFEIALRKKGQKRNIK